MKMRSAIFSPVIVCGFYGHMAVTTFQLNTVWKGQVICFWPVWQEKRDISVQSFDVS
jgi:hypothetical protein